MTAPAIWIQTLPRLGERVGRALDLVNPQPEQIDFRAVATVLGRVPRFAGHTGGGALPVAQHCAEGARAILRDTGRADWAAAFLLHDAHEYAMGDIATPVAQVIGAHVARITLGLRPDLTVDDLEGIQSLVRAGITSLKSVLDFAIYRAAGMEWPLHDQAAAVVKLYDVRMLVTERNARLAAPPFPHSLDAEPVADVDLYPWSAQLAASTWYGMAHALLPCFNVDSKQNL